MKKIKTNKIMCKKCNDIIESTHRHDFKWCKCGTIAIDGGKDYLRIVGDIGSVELLTEYEEDEERDD